MQTPPTIRPVDASGNAAAASPASNPFISALAMAIIAALGLLCVVAPVLMKREPLMPAPLFPVVRTGVEQIGWDAFVVNPEAWSDVFLQFDCVVPSRPSAPAGVDVHAATGIALLSQRFLARAPTIDLVGPADPLAAIHEACAAASEAGLASAPAAIAGRFAFGEQPPTGAPFGFERLCNMWMYFQPRDLDTALHDVRGLRNDFGIHFGLGRRRRRDRRAFDLRFGFRIGHELPRGALH